MADSAIFIDYKVRQITNLSEVLFQNRTGFVTGFVFNNITYTHIYTGDFRPEDLGKKYTTAGFYDQTKFLQYLGKKIRLSDLPAARLNYNNIALAVDKDTVIVQTLKIESPYNDFCKVDKYTWDFIADEKIIDDDLNNILLPARAVRAVPPIDISLNPVAKAFYSNNIHFITDSDFIGDKNSGAYLISLIALQIHRINKDIFPLLNGDSDLSTYIDNQNFEWTSGTIFISPTLEIIQEYLDNLTSFYNSAFSNQVAISSPINEHIQNKLYWLGYVLPISGLKVVPAYNKIVILNLIAAGTILGGITGIIPNIINEEEYVIKIVQSIDSSQIDEFLAGLVNFYLIDETDVTLFQALYDKVNDRGIGAENLKIFVSEIYKLWLTSSYNPYNLDGTLKENVIIPSQYENKPVALDYEADIELWFFNYSNYDFSFSKSKISVDEKIAELPTTSIASYDIYQTLTIANTAVNTGGVNFMSVNFNGQNAVAIPIFYLKYIDDKKETENLVTEVRLTVDVLLTISGIGNLSKLQHIRTIYKLGRVALGLDTIVEGDILASYEFAQGVLGTVQITGSLGSIFVTYSRQRDLYCDVNGTAYDKAKCEFYSKLDNIFITMQLFSGVLDVATSKLISNSSKQLLQGPIPDDFNPDALAILRKFAGLADINELTELFRIRLGNIFGEDSAIWNKLERAGSGAQGELTLAERDEFIVEFSTAKDGDLGVLNNDDTLINIWSDVEDLENFGVLRKNIEFLQDLKFIKNSEGLNKEVFIGDVSKEPTGITNQYDWKAAGVHHIEALGVNGKGKIIGEKKYFDPPYSNYYEVKVSIYNEDFASSFPDSDGYKVKGRKSTFFPDDWSRQKVQQELAFAFKNKKFSYGTLFKGKMTDGVNVTFHIENGAIQTAFPSFKK